MNDQEQDQTEGGPPDGAAAEGFSLRGGERYTMTEAARLKGVSYHTVSRAVRQGRLPVVRIGRMALIAGDDLVNWQPMRERAPRRYRQEPESFSPASSRILDEALGERLQVATQLSALFEVIHAASSELSLKGFGEQVAEHFSSIFGLKRVTVWSTNLQERSGQRLATLGATLTNSADKVDITEPYLRFFTFIDMGNARVSNDPATEFGDDTHAVPMPKGPLLIVPLRVRNRTVGCIFGDRDGQPIELDHDQLSLAQVLGNQAALALDNARLREQEQFRIAQLSAILDQMTEQVRACDVHGRLNLANHADNLAMRDEQWPIPVLGSNALQNPRVRARFELDGTPIPIERHPLARALRGEHVTDWEYEVLRADNVRTRVMVSARPLSIDGEITGAVYIGRNITAQRQEEAEARERLAEIERARRRAEALVTMLRASSAAETPGAVVTAGAECLATALGATVSALRINQAGALEPWAGDVIASQFVHASMPALQDPVAIPMTITAFSRRAPVAVEFDDAGQGEQMLMDRFGASSMLVVPLHTLGVRIGALHVFPASVAPIDRQSLELAATVARECDHALDRLAGRLEAPADGGLRSRDRFLSLVAEELIPPVEATRMEVQRLRRYLTRPGADRGEAPDETTLERVVGELDRVTGLVGDLVDAARAEGGPLALNLGPTDATRIVEAAASACGARHPDRVIHVSAPAALPVTWDEERIHQVVTTLIDNALRYAPGGPIELSAREVESDQIEIAVRDYGPGIPTSLRERVFTEIHPFEDAPGGHATSPMSHGFGLGLFLGAHLARSHGGSLTAADATGGGAILTLTLPRLAGGPPA